MTTAANTLPRELGPRLVHSVSFDVESVRRDFPILSQKVRGKALVYLDNAATSQKPQAVIETIARYYAGGNANIHRGVHFLSEHATEEHEAAREAIRRFINAGDQSGCSDLRAGAR